MMASQYWSFNCFVKISIVLHVFLIAFGEYWDAISDLKYTDVDYDVFCDAADSVVAGGSPFDRKTYRYTPLLAWILYPGTVWNNRLWGKIVFSIGNIMVGYISYRIIQFQKGADHKTTVWCAAVWLLNPLTAIIASRGNAESLVAFIKLCALYFVLQKKSIVGGFVYGLAVHFKIYPVIYVLPLYSSFLAPFNEKRTSTVWQKCWFLFRPQKDRMTFLASSAVSFLTLSYFFYTTYGIKYIEEAFLYHVQRSDIKHNFSAYFYMLYLTSDSQTVVTSILAFLPQAILVMTVAWKFCGNRHLPFCLFLQTFVFVAFNKVCTSQYFYWYLCFLPVVWPRLRLWKENAFEVLIIWLSSQACWLFAAYLLEFKGLDTFVFVWLASLGFLISNVYVIRFFLRCYAFT